MSKPFQNQPQASPALVTAEQIRAEHTDALLALTPDQRRAIQRRQQATQRSHVDCGSPDETPGPMSETESNASGAGT